MRFPSLRRSAPVLLCLLAAGCGGGVSVGLGLDYHDWGLPDPPPPAAREPGLFLVAGNLCPTCTGSFDGRGSAAGFDTPDGLASDGAGTLYVAERGSATIRRVGSDGAVTTIAGRAGQPGNADGAGGNARFQAPSALVIDGANTLFVADTGNHTVRRITAAGMVSTLAGQPGVCGSADGSAATARFCQPQGIALDRHGNLWVADQGNHTVRRIAPDGQVSTAAGRAGMCGAADGHAGLLCQPAGVAVDERDNVYIADTGNHTVRLLAPGGALSTLAGQAGQCGSTDGNAAVSRLCAPRGISADANGHLYVADAGNGTIRWIDLNNVTRTLAGVPGQQRNVLGPLPAGLERPQGIAIAETGALAVSAGNLVLKLVPRR